MFRFTTVLLLAAFFLLPSSPASAQDAPKADLFVAPDGNDAWSGKLAAPNAEKTDGPLATVARAQQAARALAPSAEKPVTVLIRGGTYALSAPLAFAPEDSFTTYAAYPGEKPVLSGGVRLTGFQVNDKGHWTLTIPEVKDGGWNFIQLFVNGERRFRPRLPKKGVYYIADTLEPSGGKQAKGFDRLKFSPGQVKADWHALGDVELLVTQSWTMARMRIKSVDEAAQVVNFTGHTRGTQWYSSFRKDWPFIVENVREALGEPGEFYLDRATGVLTYVPKPGEDPATAVVVAPKFEQLVTLKGAPMTRYVRKLTFRGLTFAHSNWATPPEGNNYPQAEVNLGGAISLNQTRDVVIDGCDVRGVGTYAIDVAEDNKRTVISNCVIADCGAGGVKVGLTSFQRREAFITSHTAVRNNLITGLGRLHPAAVGVWVGHSPDNVVEHNEISDLYYTGISVGWSWGYNPAGALRNTFAFNHVYNVGQGVLSDMGGLYSLGQSDGSVVRNNLFHDIIAFDYGGWGIYFDEGTTNMLAEDNVVYNTKTGGFHQHYGKDNVVRNNVFAFSRTDQLQRTRKEQHRSFTFERNIVIFNAGTLLGSNWDDADKYVMDRNVYWRTDGKPIEFARVREGRTERRLSFAEWQARGQDRNSVIADPMFEDAEKFNFALKPGSPALKLGFKPIDLSKVGPSPDVLARRPAAAPPGFPLYPAKR